MRRVLDISRFAFMHVGRDDQVEQLTWKQLGRHEKPVLLANVDNFWEPLFALLAHMRATQFIRSGLSVDILKAERSRTSCRAARCRRRHVGRGQGKWRPKSHAGFSRPTYSAKRHRLDAIAVGIGDEGRVVFSPDRGA